MKALTTATKIPTDFENKYTFNASEVLGLLLQLRELRDYEITLSEIFDGGIQLKIGGSVYQIFELSDGERTC